jgi:hypothetical protein
MRVPASCNDMIKDARRRDHVALQHISPATKQSRNDVEGPGKSRAVVLFVARQGVRTAFSIQNPVQFRSVRFSPVSDTSDSTWRRRGRRC